MQSRLAEAMISSGGLVSASITKRLSQWLRAASSTNRTADPAIHSGDSEGIDADEAAKAAAAEEEEEEEQLKLQQEVKGSKLKEENAPLKVPLVPSQPKLENTPVTPLPNPCTQQKRRFQATSLEDVSCVGVDGTPLPMGGDGKGLEQQYEQQEQDEKEYYKYHKPYPLSEVEFVDTRKPITRATDGTAEADEVDARVVIGWREEQLDTVDEALERAARIWRENAMRGDPNSPQSRALRALLGELN